MKITLKKPHTHNGKTYPAGTDIEVSLLDAIWLKGEDVIEQGFDALKAEVKKLTDKADVSAHDAALKDAQAKQAANTAATAVAEPAATPAAAQPQTSPASPASGSTQTSN